MKIGKIKIKISTLLIAICAIAFVIIAPIVNEGYSMMILNLGLIYAIAAYGLSVMLGMGGQLTFAAVSFLGSGAYIVGNLTTGRLGFAIDTGLALIIAIIVTTLFAYLIGSVLFRLRGTYFTFSTIGLVQVTWCFFLNYKPLFGGPDGVPGIPALSIFGHQLANYNEWFYVLAFFVAVVAIGIERIRSTQLGRSLASIRDNEIAAQTLGVNVYATKVIAFTIAGGLAGFAGALYGMHSQFVSADMFTFERATSYIIMVMLGGVNSTPGVFLGSVLVTMLPEWLRDMKQYLQLFYGIGVICLMVFMPMGIAGLVGDTIKKYKFKKKKQMAKDRAKKEEVNK